MIAKDLSEQKELDVNPEVIKQIGFTANLDEAGYTKFFSLLKK